MLGKWPVFLSSLHGDLSRQIINEDRMPLFRVFGSLNQKSLGTSQSSAFRCGGLS